MSTSSPHIIAAGLACLLTSPLAAVDPPVPVAPGSAASGSVVASHCPSFHWGGVAGARVYELVVFQVSDDHGMDSDERERVAAEPTLRLTLPGSAQGWAPSLDRCLEAGARYAWSLRALAGNPRPDWSEWSETSLFQVAPLPAAGEIEAALATLRRHLESGGRSGEDETVASDGPQIPRISQRRTEDRHDDRRPDGEPGDELKTVERLLRAPLVPASGELRGSSTLAAVPVLASPSLTVSSDVVLGAASDFFKDGKVFLWDDAAGNTALGRSALASANDQAIGNTAVGRHALRNATAGPDAVFEGSFNAAFGDQALDGNTYGSRNTATGTFAMFANTTGGYNTATGYRALYSNTEAIGNTAHGSVTLVLNTTGALNTATGAGALYGNITGSRNTATGAYALAYSDDADGNTATGFRALLHNTEGPRNTASGAYALSSNTTGFSNTGSGFGALEDNESGLSNTAFGVFALRNNTTGDRNVAIGYLAGTGAPPSASDNVFISSNGEAGDSSPTIRIGDEGTHKRTFVAGIQGITVGSDAVTVVIDGNGRLGTKSSSRAVKQDIRDTGELSERLRALRPVAFRYRQHVQTDPDTPLEFGLIAEEVSAIFPELVVYDEEGRPETVKYHLLSTLLLNELQRQQVELRHRQQENDELRGELSEQRRDVRAVRERVDRLERAGPGS